MKNQNIAFPPSLLHRLPLQNERPAPNTTFFADLRLGAPPARSPSVRHGQIAAHKRPERRIWAQNWTATLRELQPENVRSAVAQRGASTGGKFERHSWIKTSLTLGGWFSSSAIRKPTLNTVPGRCGTSLRWSVGCRSMRPSGNWVSFWRRAPFPFGTRFSRHRSWPFPSKTLSSKRICGSVSFFFFFFKFKSNFPINFSISHSPCTAESFCTKGKVFQGVRRHARARVGKVEYFHCHYFVRLEEGTPPADYYGRQTTPEKQLDDFMEGMRKRKIIGTL